MVGELTAVLSSLNHLMNSNTGTIIFDKIDQAKTNRDKDKAINELEQLINELNREKTELIKISSTLESELIAKKISEDEITFISEKIIPVLEGLLLTNAKSDDQKQKVNELIQTLRPLLAKETFMILQSLGFNFKEAIGEPLTELVKSLITSQVTSQSKQQNKQQNRKK